MKETKLLNCPFCGGEAYLREFKELSGTTTDYYVECGNIECGVSPETPIFGTPEKAIKAWNTRKPMERILERLEETLKVHETQAVFSSDSERAYMKAIKIVKEEGGIE